MDLNAFFSAPLAALANEPWLIRIVAVFGATILIAALANFFLRHLARLARRTPSYWDDALHISARRPLQLAIWLFGIGVIAQTLYRQFEDPLLADASTLRNVGLALCGAWFLFVFITRLTESLVTDRLHRGDDFDRTTVDAISKLARLIVAVVAVLVVLQTLGVSITGVLTVGGIGGIAIGFAAKDLLANFFGGLTIYLDRPFSVGDWIRSPDKAFEGTVEHISWRHTRVRAFNKNPIYVPNALFTTVIVENPSRMSHRRIKETIGVCYEDFAKVAAIVEAIRAMLASHPDIDAEQTLIVNFNSFAASSLDILIYTFTRTVIWTEYHVVKQSVLLKVGEIITAHGAEFAYPTQTVHLSGSREPDESDAHEINKPQEKLHPTAV